MYNYNSGQPSFLRKSAETKTSKNGIDNSERQITKKKRIRRPASIPRQNQPKLKPINRMRKMKAPRVMRARPKRYVRKPALKVRKEVFENDIENIDIDDPEVQEELSRQLAGEYEDEEDPREEEPEADFENEREDDPYADEAEPQDGYNEEDRLEHDDY